MTYLTLKVADENFEVKTDRDYRSELGVEQKIAFDLERLYFFDSASGLRIR